MVSIVLKGYYGFGNLGDDLLMITSCRWIKEVFPKSKLQICTASSSGGYIYEISEGLVDEVLPLYPEPVADLVIHGGGGTYFDFDNGGIGFYVLNKIVDALGPQQLREITLGIRRMKENPNSKKTLRIALGIGIGEFKKSSKKYYQKMLELVRFHLILTRDNLSYQTLIDKKIKGKVVNSTDLGFLNKYWIKNIRLHSKPEDKNIGMVLRYWRWDNTYLTALLDCARKLQSDGYNISIFFFENAVDLNIKELFTEFAQYSWNPEITTISEYLNIIKQQSLMITARAHGAVIAAALGIPSVCIGIEPKLKIFHSMLPKATRFAECPLESEKLIGAISEARRISSRIVQSDFHSNTNAIESDLQQVSYWIEQLQYENG